jgi:hypothetical protein
MESKAYVQGGPDYINQDDISHHSDSRVDYSGSASMVVSGHR